MNMPDRKEPRLDIDPVKPTAPAAAHSASPVKANRAEPDAVARPAPRAPVQTAADRPGRTSRPEAEAPRHQQPVESAYRKERVGSVSQDHAGGVGGSGGGGAGGHYPAQLESSGSGSGSSSLLVWFALLLALAGLAFGGWQYLRADQQQQSMQRLADRVQELEIRLSETGQDLSKAGSTFREQLEWADSEIRKLWVVAHQRNLPAITELQNKMKAVEERATKAEAQLKDALAASSASRQVGNEVKAQLQALNDKMARDLRELGQRLTEVTLATSTLDQRLRNQDQSSKLTALTQKVGQLEQRVAAGGVPPELQQKMAEQEEILASLEASRNQLVSRVTRLMEDVQVLQQAR